MKNLFKLFKVDEKNREKNNLERQIKDKAWDITKKVPLGKLKMIDVNELEKLYKEYFIKFPDKEKEKSCHDRIVKLKHIM